MGFRERFLLTGKTALVTGCRRGLGKAIAEGLAEAGADIIGVSASLESESEIEKTVLKLGRQFQPYQCDFSNREDLYQFINTVKGKGEPVDILVNNAGTLERKPIVEHPDEDWDKVIEVNLNSQFILSREFGKDMVKRGNGKIIFIASILSFQGGLTVPGYTASKGAIGQLTMALSNEWASLGVNVNAIAPGYFATDINLNLREDPVRNPALLSRIPAGHYGDPEDLKGPVVFLASEASNYVHGTLLTVDGGWMGR
ncbi:MAG: SDR family NAD(P)-dependent oxidoreductase [SAR324 cluster bacterium]|nr:SDR family NAD(P)-dependent oxidoreductase [SAR324 cluster bacterium]